MIINPDNYLIKVPDRKITAKHVEDIVSGIVSRYLAGSEGSTASHWASFPLSPLEVKFSVSIFEALTHFAPL